jgi:polygalacturonase
MIQGQYVNVLDYGADNTGSTDTTAAIQAAINGFGVA